MVYEEREREEALTFSGISVIEMPVRPTLGIMTTGHDVGGARLLTPIGVGTIITSVTEVTMGTE